MRSDEINAGLDRFRSLFATDEFNDQFDDNELVDRLIQLKESLREHFSIGRTLDEQLADAVAAEEYELAARAAGPDGPSRRCAALVSGSIYLARPSWSRRCALMHSDQSLTKMVGLMPRDHSSRLDTARTLRNPEKTPVLSVRPVRESFRNRRPFQSLCNLYTTLYTMHASVLRGNSRGCNHFVIRRADSLLIGTPAA